MIERMAATELLRGLVAIPSLSHEEETASCWLAGQMLALGYARAYVDEAGNAVGEIGPVDAERVLVLLGHIDTVAGYIPVHIEETPTGPVLYGRGSVDAKGPLATFAAAVARLGAGWADQAQVRVVVVGAVEEEAASSKGARHVAARFDGRSEPIPMACIIGEPSGWSRVTLGYKGRLLVEVEASQPMAHTAGPDAGIAAVAVDLWNWCTANAERHNAGKERAFDQLSLTLRHIATNLDNTMQDRVEMTIGWRLPLGFDPAQLARAVIDWAAARAGVEPPDVLLDLHAGTQAVVLQGSSLQITLRFRGHEDAWRSERDSALVRSCLGAIREVEREARPGFVVKTGTSDMNVVGPVWKCPILAYGPGDSSLDHTPHEHMSVDEYWRAILVLERAIRKLVG
jgi:LysW-gamma-L-lysine carboxypeptidase